LYDFRLEEVAAWIKQADARVAAIQLPEGLKVHAISIAEQLERTAGVKCLILGDPCYGACDYVARFDAYADVLVQFGHSDIPSMEHDPRVLFVEVYIDIDVSDLLESALPRLKGRIGLLTTAQHVRMLPSIRTWLEARGKVVLIGKGDARVKFEGQVLGCNVTAADPIDGDVDQYLYVGSGDFHPIAVAIDTDKPVLVLDPLMREVRELGELKERILRQRHGAIVRAENARRFLIIVSTKVGQMRLDLAYRLRALAEEHGKEAEIVLMEEVSPDLLRSYDVDAYVSTACPRIAVDDYLKYPQPILTPPELEIVLGVREWKDYRMDRILG
jgi:2-(3-amino-3-carboxypropyl)histidine synthase